MTTPREYRNLLSAGKLPAPGSVTKILGRILRGKLPVDFATTTNDIDPGERAKGRAVPNRMSVLLVDADACRKLIGAGGTYAMLKAVGYAETDIEKHYHEGLEFKLLICADDGSSLGTLGTWDNVIATASKLYPQIAGVLAQHAIGLKNATYAEIMKTGSGLGFSQVKSNDPEYMSADKLARLGYGATLRDVRRFFYDSLHLRALFRGDGFTYDAAGVRGVEEYVAPTCELSRFGNYELIDLPALKLPSASGRASQGNELPMPPHFNGANARSYGYSANSRELALAAPAWRAKYGIKAAAADAVRIVLLLIDLQKDFCFPEGTLYVAGKSGSGAIDDNRRIAEYVYRYLNVLTGVIPTQDTHMTFQIFFPIFWKTGAGDDCVPNTEITVVDIKSGKYVVNPLAAGALGAPYAWLQAYALHYCEQLEKAGKYKLFLWNEHCLLGSEGHALAGLIQEARVFHSLVRGAQNQPEIKGGNPLTENYSVMQPEVLTRQDGSPIAQRNTKFLQTLLANDYVVIAGQAGSHCVASSIRDLLNEIMAKDPKLAAKVYIMRDCMSAVVIPGIIDYTAQADAALAEFAAAGMHVVDSTTPMSQWPGMKF
jgi:nicotinamidase-related amidase